MFEREIIQQLLAWKTDKNRKPLIIHGARQVGKTWVLKHFGKEQFEDVAYFSLDRALQSILDDYALDFVKHTTPALASCIHYVWNSLPSQLAKENRKFVYQLVRPGARAREYEDVILWLEQSGLVDKVVVLISANTEKLKPFG